MNQPSRRGGNGSVLSFCLLSLLAGLAPRARAADDGGQDLRPSYDRDDDVPTGARRAAEWEPSREGAGGEPWHFGAAFGVAFFSGDSAVDGDAGFLAELRASRDLTEYIYFVGSYALAFARTDVIDPLNGSSDRDTAVLHVPTVGIGFRAEVTPEIRLFVEPKIGALFGGDADAAPVGGATAGIDIELDPGIAIRVGFTGLLTDTSIETSAGDADLTGIWSIGIGLVFEF